MSVTSQVETAIEKAVRVAKGQTALARLMGSPYKQQNIEYWVRTKRVPAPAALRISAVLNNAVTKHELCPEAYPVELTGDAA